MSRHRCWGSSSVGLWSFDHNGVQGRLQQLGIVHVCSRNHNAQGAALSIHKETALGTSLATVRRVGPNQVPPKRALPMAPSARLPFPVHAIQLFAPLHQGSPHSVQDARPHPPLKGAMNGAVVPKLFRQSVPLAPAAQPEDDAVEHLSWVRALAAPGFGRVFLQDDRFRSVPKARPVLPRWSLASLVSPCGPSRCFWRNHTNRPRNRSMHLWFRF